MHAQIVPSDAVKVLRKSDTQSSRICGSSSGKKRKYFRLFNVATDNSRVEMSAQVMDETKVDAAVQMVVLRVREGRANHACKL